jgi:hypothetical protein
LCEAPEPIAQGKAKAKVFLEENPTIAADLEAKLRGLLFTPPSTGDDEESENTASENPVDEKGNNEDGDDQSSRDAAVTY